MNPRERMLAIVVAAAVGLLVLIFVGVRVRGAFTTRSRTIADLREKVTQAKRKVEQGERAARRVADWTRRSLPRRPDVAGSQYQQWLFELIGQEQGVGLIDANVTSLGKRKHGKAYHLLTFKVDGQGKLDQLVELLYRFYQVDQLHRLRMLKAQPQEDSKLLELSITIEALVLPAAEDVAQWTPSSGQRTPAQSLAAYRQAILGRNLFAPPNTPPRLGSIRSVTTNPRRPVAFTAQATDADPLDHVRYELEGDAPDGAKIDAPSGRFTWTPDELGTFSVTVCAVDDGFPEARDRETVEIRVVEPEPVVVEPPKMEPKKLDFDDAEHAYLDAIVRVNGQWQLWLNVRTKGRQLKLFEGDAISVGSVEGVVSRIRTNSVEILAEQGRLLVGLGENLTQATLLPADDG